MVMPAASVTAEKHLVIGAGFVGLGIAQALQAADIPYDQVDASDAIGGNWHHGVYTTAHIISSKKVTQFSHYPMPDDYPHFPSAQQILEYLNRFSDHYDLGRHLQLGRKVILVRPIEGNQWEVTYDGGSSNIYKGVILCNGHHWCQRMPTFRGHFDGEIIHSKAYRQPSQLHGKNVVVIGGGNSACDIAAEAARVARSSVLSLRESVWFIPKSVGGVPLTNLVHPWMPEWLQLLIVHTIIRIVFGSHQSYGLTRPTHRLFSKHPTLNNEVPYYIMHGRITVKPAVKPLIRIRSTSWMEAQRRRI